jgi:hypothetical protein
MYMYLHNIQLAHMARFERMLKEHVNPGLWWEP